MRITLAQVRQSRLPAEIGKLATDIPGIAAYVNQAQQQLINAGGETGWWGGWSRVAFQVSRCNPYLTLPRQFARIINLDVCRWPIRIQNEFYEMLDDGIGLQDFGCCGDWCGTLEGYERGTYPTMVDISPSNQLLQVYITDPRDTNKRILFGPCLDQNGNFVYSTDTVNNVQVNGFYLTFSQPFTTSEFIVTNIGGVQKDPTFGDVLVYQMDATTGAQVLLARYGPDEINPSYRRYYFNHLPNNCAPVVPGSSCIAGQQPTPTSVAITALCKLDYVPVSRDTDWLVIGNIPALIEECKAVRYRGMETDQAMRLAVGSHANAIALLNQELGHYLGKLNPAVNFAPFGKAHLGKVMSAVRTG